jgi:tagatose 6-phosphate kinase
VTKHDVGQRIIFIAANPSIDRLYEVERLVTGAIHRPAVVIARPGGKGLNAARAALALGARVTAIGIVAGDAGSWIVARLVELGIDARIVRSTGETRSCVTIVDRSTGALTELYEPGEAIESRAWDELEDLVEQELHRGDVGALALSGSLPTGAPGDGYARLARMAAARSTPVLADTYGSALSAVLEERPTVVKVNATEAATATHVSVSDPVSAAAAARVLRDRGAASAIVTLGVVGCVVSTGRTDAQLVPPAVRGAYPVGSGDAFLAGLAIGIVAGDPLVEAARRGAAAGIANALQPGTGDLHASVANKFIDDVVVTPLDR